MAKAHELHYPILRDIGFSEAEAVVYEVLIEQGPATGAELTERSGFGRGNVYNALAALKERGFVEEEAGAKTTFRPHDPEMLRRLASSQVRSAQELLGQLEGVLPGLKSSFALTTKRPTVRMFEGIEGLKEVYRETLKEKQPIYALLGPDEPNRELYQWLTRYYVRDRVAAGVHAYVVASGSTVAEEYQHADTKTLRTTRLVQSSEFPFRGEVDVFGGKVALIAYKEDEMIGLIIESASLAETLRSVIRLLFQHLPTDAPADSRGPSPA